ncbi:Crp/Fnr family transcriptional regulator [Bacillus sp. EB106-08-02-XG196]|uniref:Crp/Fnr family transcriptional regulator n=1 Tax=Bacillus sp. EB106-08-02-XG196 TaxID=2737049 RepID=UPI0015C46E56|nr:Crp/Fnr family transcriptional regulator [Bacillus sp. EB106-08-02-XG196]NWQ41688.1 Crp/Fnr family transcriptional regulator [Bacillus sp. EB106-08-02-XG196]
MKNLRNAWGSYLKYGNKLVLEENSVVYRQGGEGKGFFFLYEGGIKITLLTKEGVERTVNYVPKGMLFGEQGSRKQSYLTSALTTRTSIVYHFSDDALENICHNHPEAACIFTNSLIYKFRILAEIIAFLNSPVEQQMAHYLLKLINENGSFSIDQTSFAHYIGTSRITVNKILNKWKSQKIIDLTNRTIDILDINRLKELRESGGIHIDNLDLLILTNYE